MMYPEAETAQPGQRGTTRSTHTERAHTLGNGDTTQQPRELAAAAAAPPPPLLLLLLCCCCAAAASRPAMHRGAQAVSADCFSFCFLERTQERVTAQQQQQQ